MAKNKQTATASPEDFKKNKNKTRKLMYPRMFLENLPLKKYFAIANMSRMSRGKFSIELYNSRKMFS